MELVVQLHRRISLLTCNDHYNIMTGDWRLVNKLKIIDAAIKFVSSHKTAKRAVQVGMFNTIRAMYIDCRGIMLCRGVVFE